MQLDQLRPHLWRWTADHPDWRPGDDWDQEVGCVAADAGDALALIDPLVPDDGWAALDELVERVGKPVATLLTVEWHARSSDAVRGRYPRHDGLPEHTLLVIDAAYAEYVTRNDYAAGLELAQTADNVVVTRTFSKIHGLAGLRIGWAYAPASVCDVLNRIRGPFNVARMQQMVGAAAIRDRKNWSPFIVATVRYTSPPSCQQGRGHPGRDQRRVVMKRAVRHQRDRLVRVDRASEGQLTPTRLGTRVALPQPTDEVSDPAGTA